MEIFATDSDWTKGTGTTISGGNANFSNATGVSLYQDIGIQSGNVMVSFTITNYTSGTLNVYSGMNQGIGTINVVANAVGSYVAYVDRNGGNVNIIFGSGDNFIGSISNVSVKESTKNNLARVDYDGTASSLLVEPERTNLITYSSDFSESSWTKLGSATVIADTTISPDGTLNADSFSFTTSTSDKIQQTVTVVASQQYTVSCYIKSDSNITIKMGGAAASTPINVTTEWVRHTVIQTNGAGTTAYPQLTSNGTEGTIYVYGFQLEQGSYPTSYIPTDGGTVTRVKDQYSKTGISNLINSEEGVLFVEMASLSDDGTSRLIGLSDGTSTKRINIYYDTSSNSIYGLLLNSSVQGITSFTLSDSTNFAKIAFKYKENDFALWVNGTEVDTDSSGTTFTSDTLNKLSFDRADGVAPFFGKVKQLQIFKTALTDSELIALTTI